jgi:hypothetical protein
MSEEGTVSCQAGRSRFSITLLMLVLAALFAVPLLPDAVSGTAYNILISAILVFAALSMYRDRGPMFVVAMIAMAMEWLAVFLDLTAVFLISQAVLFVYFVMVVIGLVMHIARTECVTGRVIIESITGYLLLGIVFSMLVAVVARNVPDAYSFGNVAGLGRAAARPMSEYIYYGFTTYTTLGYGDIVPLDPVSRALAILASVTGQIYLTVIIAMLVGKFIGSRNRA